MKTIVFFAILMCAFAAISCNGQKHDVSTVQINAAVKEMALDITGRKTIEGYLRGVNPDKNEVYVSMIYPEKNNHIVKIINPQTGDEAKSIRFPRGDPQSPTDFEEPSFIEYLDGKYYVLDHIDKIVAYDSGFKYLYTGMFYNHRIFIDFYIYNNDVYFLFGNSKNLLTEYRYNIESYCFRKGKKPVKVETIFETNRHETPYVRNGNKYFYIIFFQSSNWAFEKDGNIFYADNRENKYYRYNLTSKKIDAFELPYLKSKRYSKEEAIKAGQYKGFNWEKVIKRLKPVIVPAADATYHQGIYDVGKNKIGIIADLDMSSYTFRFDVFDSRTGQYNFSIRLPFGEGFLRRTSSENLGYLQSYIDFDRGMYVWPDMDEENFDGTVEIMTFTLKTGIP